MKQLPKILNPNISALERELTSALLALDIIDVDGSKTDICIMKTEDFIALVKEFAGTRTYNLRVFRRQFYSYTEYYFVHEGIIYMHYLENKIKS